MDAEIAWPDRPMSDRSLKVAMTGYVHDDDPTVIADMQQAIDKLRGTLGNCRCPRPANGRPDGLLVSECVACGECGCDVGAALVTDFAPSAPAQRHGR